MRWRPGAAALVPVITLAALVTLFFLWNVEITGNTALDDVDPLPVFIDDPPVLFGLRDFKYLIEPKPCAPEPKLGTLLVTSHYSHVEKRSALRRGYTPKILEDVGFRMVFLLAEPPQPTDSKDDNNWQQGSIEDEARRFGDILQGSFLEAYRNLTYKNTMGLLWAAKKCSSATFTAKMDDDVAVNIFELAREMRKRTGKLLELTGSVIAGGEVRRTAGDKWYVSTEEYSEKFFPSYLSGWLYFGPSHLLGRIAYQATKMPYLFIDDVFLLGVAREKLFGNKVVLRDFGKRFSYQYSEIVCCLALRKTTCGLIVGPTNDDTGLMLRFVRRAILCADGTKCFPPAKTNRSCTGDARAIAEQIMFSLAERNNATVGNASPVPL